MDAIGVVLLSLLAVVVSGLLARMSRLPAPLVQMALGAAIFYTSLTSVVLDPETFFLLFLPPLLFLDGWRMPRDALVRDASTILRLALGLVLFTVLGMGLFIHWLIPAMPLALSFALAAVVSPTDPVAVSAIAARTPLPRRLMHILQGEALLNDATGLVCMRLAVAAALTGSFSFSAALGNFAWLACGGLAVGAGVTWLVARAARWASARFGEDGGGQILITVLLPFGVYQLAEALHCSGILAAVAAGFTLGLTDVWPWRAGTRLQRTAVWDTLQFAANGSVFVLLGEQLPALVAGASRTVREASHQDPWWLVLYVVVIVAALLALRFLWVWASLKLRFARAGLRGDVSAPTSWRVVLVASLAGVRGAVTLAGVMTLPLVLGDRTPFPARDLAILLAAGVIVLWLVLATVALPGVLRSLDLPDEPSQHAAENQARQAAAEAALRAVETAAPAPDGIAGETAADAAVRARIADAYRQRIARHGDGAAPAQRRAEDSTERRLRLLALRAERTELLRYGRAHGLEELTLRRIVRELDLLETHHGG